VADAKRYAEWIVANQDKKGTPEFDTVAQAYRAARSATPTQASDEELRARYGFAAPAEEAPEGPTIRGEFGRGLESLLSSARTTGAAVFGNEEEAALAGLERQRQIAEEYGEGPSFDRVKRAYEEDGLLSAAGTAAEDILPAVAGQAPIWGALAAGALAGQAAIPVPILGGAIGAAAVGLPMFFGSNVERQAGTQLEEGVPVDINTGRALAAAAGQTALESAGAAATFGKGIVKSILKIADDTQLDSAAARDLTGAALAKLRGQAATPVTMGARAGAAGRGALTAATVEMPTEMAQQVLERAQAGLDVLSPEALAEYGEAAYLAGIAGGTVGGATRVGEPGRVQRRAEGRLRDVAEEEAQDEFTAVRQELENRGQMELGGLEPVLAPTTTAGEAQQEAARQYELGTEEYRTRRGEQRYARPGTLAEPALPTVVNDLDAFNYMKEQGLTEATALETIPQDPKSTDRKMFNAVKAQMNETALVELAAAEAARVARAPGEAPLVIDTRKSIAELDPAEREVLARVVERIQSKASAPGTQQRLPKALTNILAGEKATVAKAEEDAVTKKREDAAAQRAQKQADREAEKAQAAADKEAQRAAAQAQKQADIQARQAAQQAEAARKTGLAEIAPKKVDLIGSLQARKTPIELAQDQEAEDIAKAQKRQGVRPTAPPAAPKFPTTQEERTALAKEIGLSLSLGMVKDKGILAEYATQDLADPAVAARFVADLETKKKDFKGDYADKNTAAVDTLIARFAPKKETPAVVDELGGDAIDTTTQRVEGTSKDVQVPTPTKRPRAKKASAPTTVVEEPTPTDTVETSAEITDTADIAAGDSVVESQRAAIDELVTREMKAKKKPSDAWNPEEKATGTEDDVKVSTEYRGTALHNAFLLSRLLSSYAQQKQAVENAEPGQKRAAQSELTSIAKALKELKVPRKALDKLDASQLRQAIDIANKNARAVLSGAGRYALENATNSPKLEGDLLDAVTSGNLKQTISLLLGKTAKRPEVQQILKRIQSMGLKTKIVVAGRPTSQRQDNLDPLPAEAEAVQAGVEGKSALEAANFIARSATDPAHRVVAKAVAQKLRELEAAGTAPSFEVLHVGDKVSGVMRGVGVRGQYDPNNNAVSIKGADVTGSVGASYRTVLHELVHAVTANLVRQGNLRSNTDVALAESTARLLAVANAVVKHFNQRVADSERGKVKLTDFEQSILRREFNTLQNADEVLTWTLTDPDAQAYMESIPYQGKNTWTVFVQAVRRILGLAPSADTTLSEILSVAESYFGKSAARAATLTARSTPVGASLEGKAGAYDPVTDTITLDPKLGLNEHTLIHELSHAALAERIADPKSKEAKEFDKFFQIVKNQLGSAYGGTDVQEFAAELMGNEQFAASLKAIKAPKGGNLLQRIVQTLAEFFGFRKGQSVYDAGIKYINELLNVPASAEPTLTEKLFMGTANPKSAAEVLTELGLGRKKSGKKAVTGLAGVLKKLADSELGGATLRPIMRGVFGLLRTQNIYAVLRDMGPKFQPMARAVKALGDAAEARLGYTEQQLKIFEDKYQEMLKPAKQHAAAMKRMFTMAEDAMRAGLDLLDPEFKPTPQQQETYNRLQNVLNNLPPSVRDVYTTLRKDYDDSYKASRELLLESYADNPTLRAEMRKKFEAEHPRIGYIPSMRFGDFVLEYTDKDTGRRTVQQFESVSARDEAIDDLDLAKGEYEEYSRMADVTYSADKMSSTVVKQIMDSIAAKGASQGQLNAVYQVYLSTFPSESYAKRMMKFKDVAGASDDMLRAYANTMTQWVRHTASAKYLPRIETAMKEIRSQSDVGGVTTQAIADTLAGESAAEFQRNPTFSTLVSGTTAVSYAAYILGNVSSALINLTALPIGYAQLAARYGAGVAYDTMTKAVKIATPISLKDMVGTENAWGAIPAEYKPLIQKLLDQGQLQHTQTREILEGRGKRTEESGGVMGAASQLGVDIMDYGSRPFSAAEKINRAAIAIAAYDAALKGGNGIKPMTKSAAMEYALEVVKDVNTSGTAATGPQLFQTPIGRVVGTFKGFAMNQAFIIARSAYLTFRGADPETRRLARRHVLSSLAVTTALSGVSGAAFVMPSVAVVSSLMQAMFGDDDDDYEYFNTDEWMRDITTSLEQQFRLPEDILYKGLFNSLTGLAVADRAAITENLFFREDTKLVEDIGYVRAMLIQLLGPSVGYAFSAEQGYDLAKQGEWGRAMEKMLPIAVGNFFKGWRFLNDKTALTQDGEPIVENIDKFYAIMQMGGLAPAELSMRYEERQMAAEFDAKTTAYKDQLLDALWAARQSGDEEAFEEAREKLVQFGRRYPGLVKPDTIRSSFNSRMVNLRDNVAGLTIPPAIRAEIIRRFRLED